MCPDYEEDKIMNKVYAGELPSSATVDDLEGTVMKAFIDSELEGGTALSTRTRLDLIGIRRRLQDALGCTTSDPPCKSPKCPEYQARRPSSTKLLY